MPRALSISATPEALILGICLVAGTLLTSLPYEERDGGLVPTVIFLNHPAAFRIFVLSLLLAATASAGAIMHNAVFPGYSRLCRRAAGASLLVASASLVWCSVWWGLALCGSSAVVLCGGLKLAGG